MPAPKDLVYYIKGLNRFVDRNNSTVQINRIGSTGPTGLMGPTGPGGGSSGSTAYSNFIPDGDLTYDLGSTDNRWRSLYVGASTIYIGDGQISFNNTNNTVVLSGIEFSNGAIMAPTGENGEVSFGAIKIGPSGINSVIDITYSDLRIAMGSSPGSLIPFNYYRIIDYKTCYDQPDFNYVGNAILVGNYKDDAPVQPIIVLATSDSTLAEEAYQPDYPKDRIKYDVSFNVTERLGGTAYGRITERIDEFNNRSDYDHRQVKFKRYKYYEIDFRNPYQGTVQVSVVSGTAMTVTGNGTNFSSLSVGNKVGFGNDNDYRVYEISNISSATGMTITGLSNVSLSSGTKIYPADWDEYSSYHQNNVDDPSTNFEEYYTFLTLEAIDGNGNINNYIGNYANFYQWNENDFILANNVFQNRFQRNTFGDNCYNNTFFDDCTDNHIGNHFYNNITDDDFDSNLIGNYFYGNKITANFYDNRIGENFRDNYLVQNDFYRNNIMNDFRNNMISADFQNNEVGSQFNNNKIYADFYKNDIGNDYNYNQTYSEVSGNFIGNGFANNNIYSGFYDNQIGEYFNDNQIGDSGNKSLREFDKNSIADNFEENQILSSFTHNQIGSNFFSNEVNGVFHRNVIGYGYQDNTVGYNFSDNRIGNYFDSNQVGDGFSDNSIGNGFESNEITYDFSDNQIGNQFDNNTFGDTQYFTWNNTSYVNLTARDYEIFADALDGRIDDFILNKNLILYDTVNDEYHKVKFTQWTIGNNGGGFSYERTKLFGASGSTGATGVGETVYFTKTNYGSEIDIIAPGSLEITRGNSDGIYNNAVQGSWDGSAPQGTLWNSVYTQSDVGAEFQNNVIENEFKGNYIKRYFQGNKIESIVGGNEFLDGVYANQIGSYTFSNDFLGLVGGNIWSLGFNTNIIGPDFSSNQIGSQFEFNNIGQGFSYNQIGHRFEGNTAGDGFGFGIGDPQGNKIGNNFHENIIGEYFYNNTIADNFGGNTAGDYFQMNDIKIGVTGTDFTEYIGSIENISYVWGGTSASDDYYTNIPGSNNVGSGLNATFNITVAGGTVTAVGIYNPGELYNPNDVIIISGNYIGGATGADDITVTVNSTEPSVYGNYNCEIFKNKDSINRLSFYDENDILIIKDIQR